MEEAPPNNNESQRRADRKIPERRAAIYEIFLVRLTLTIFIIEMKIVVWGWTTTGLPPSTYLGYVTGWFGKIITETFGALPLLSWISNEVLLIPINLFKACKGLVCFLVFVTFLGLPLAITFITLSFHS